MYFDEFKTSLTADFPPAKAGRELKALWWDAKGNWEKAHRLVKEMNNSSASWVHAYLHRKEGDLSNASFWYTNAGRSMPEVSASEEWDEIVRAILEDEIRIDNHFI